jgi:hypothetical protein
MQNVNSVDGEAVRYVVLYGENLQSIQDSNPGYDLLSHVNGKAQQNKK